MTSRFDKLPEHRRTAILTAAGKEFAAHGYKGASLNRIIATADISKGKFYYYFTDKAELFRRVFEFVEAMFTDGLAPDAVLVKMTAETFWDDIARLQERKMAMLADTPWVIALGKTLYTLPEGLVPQETLEQLRGQTEWLQRYLVRGQSLGVVRDDLSAATLARVSFAAIEALERAVFQGDATPSLLHDVEQLSNLALGLMQRIAANTTPSNVESQD